MYEMQNGDCNKAKIIVHKLTYSKMNEGQAAAAAPSMNNFTKKTSIVKVYFK